MPATRHENKRVARLEIARVAFGANPALSLMHDHRTTIRSHRAIYI